MITFRSSMSDRIHICQDSREQDGLCEYMAHLDCEVEAGVTLDYFDYCLRTSDGELDSFRIEYKNLQDFISSITTTEAMRREQNKIKKARECGCAPIIYAISGSFLDLGAERPCFCSWRGVPDDNCDKCLGTGIIGHNYARRKITPAFTFHQIFDIIMSWGAIPLLCDTRLGAACAIHGLLKNRATRLRACERSKELKLQKDKGQPHE